MTAATESSSPGKRVTTATSSIATAASADCKSAEICGNGILDTAVGEVCDDGNNVGGDRCSADCRSLEGCGDSKIDPGEECDPGAPNTETATCNRNCTFMRHGDGIANASADERCDGDSAGHGNGVDCESATCNANCTWSSHGDGIINPLHDGEQCDGDSAGYGNGVDCASAVCNANCTWSRHGDGIVNPFAGEQCDGGDGITSLTCESATCNANCTPSRHGDGVVNPLHDGEQCDGGIGMTNFNCESATCNANCTLMRHGDGIVNMLAGEQCDGGDGSVSATCQSATCNANCTPSWHGDGVANPLDGEECDGGNGTTSVNCESAICSANCTLSRRGDSFVNPAAGEQCDDGNDVDEDNCLNTCKLNTCGDGYVDRQGTSVEVCDLGPRNGLLDCSYGQTSCVGCKNDCSAATLPTRHYCGDGKSEAAYGETCDNLYQFGCGTCTSDCQTASKANAKGMITIVSLDITDGDALTVDDGTNIFIIEFDTVGGCQPTANACVAVGASTSSIATTVKTAINAWTGAITASIPTGNTSQVDLTFDTQGVMGNIPITTAGISVVVAPEFGAIVVEGMTGGVGCPSGAFCWVNSDCLSNACSGGRCM